MNMFQAIILSIVEGITEFLPISSTGHLVLVSNLLRIPQTEFVKSFEISIQLGAIMAIIWLYRMELLSVKIWKLVFSAFIPTAILGFVFYDFIKASLLGNVMITLAALFTGGIVIIFLDRISPKKTTLNIQRAVGIGLFQSISMIPGVSRAAATIIGGRLLGIPKEEAVKFSFLLAVPTMFAATILDLAKTSITFTPDEWSILLLGLFGSFATAMLAVKFFVRYIQKNNFALFGIYRIVLAILYFLLLLPQSV